MKTIATKIILVFLSLTVFTTGMGTTIAKFCCEYCVSDFFSEISIVQQHNDVDSDSCCAHKSEKETKSAVCHHSENHQTKDEECCKMERHSQILDSYHSKPTFTLPFAWVSQQLIVYLQNRNIEENNSSLLYYLKSPPNIIDTKTYLSIIRILII